MAAAKGNGGPQEINKGLDSETQPCVACVEGEEAVERSLNVKGARSFSQTDHRCSSS